MTAGAKWLLPFIFPYIMPHFLIHGFDKNWYYTNLLFSGYHRSIYSSTALYFFLHP